MCRAPPQTTEGGQGFSVAYNKTEGRTKLEFLPQRPYVISIRFTEEEAKHLENLRVALIQQKPAESSVSLTDVVREALLRWKD